MLANIIIRQCFEQNVIKDRPLQPVKFGADKPQCQRALNPTSLKMSLNLTDITDCLTHSWFSSPFFAGALSSLHNDVL